MEENKLRMNRWFTVNDLGICPRRSHRIFSAVGSLLQVKLSCTWIRSSCAGVQVRGGAKPWRSCTDALWRRIVDPEEQTIAISHGDCEEEARLLEDRIRAEITGQRVHRRPRSVRPWEPQRSRYAGGLSGGGTLTRAIRMYKYPMGCFVPVGTLAPVSH